MSQNVIEYNALRITVIYMLVGSAWILFSDTVMRMLLPDPELLTRLSVIKGWIFIAFTGIMLYRLIARSHGLLQQQNVELSILGQERLASEEELRQQVDELLSREEKIRKQHLVLSSLHDTVLGLMNRLDVDELFKDIVVQAAQLIGTDHAYIILGNKEKGVFDRKIGRDGTIEENNWPGAGLIEGLSGQVYQTGEIMVVDDYSTWENRVPDPALDPIKALVQVPLKSQSEVVGILELAFINSTRKFGSHEIDLLSRFAELATIALDNATLFTTYRNELAERIQTEQALQISEEKYRAVFDAANDGILIHDIETGRILDANKKAAQWCRCTTEQLVGSSFNELGISKFPYGEEVLEWFNKAVQGEPQLFESMISNEAGENSWIETNLKLATIGSERRILAIARDITERKKRELELRKSQAKNQALLHAIPDIMFLINRDGTFMDCRAKREELYVPPEAMIGKTIYEVLPRQLAQQTMQNVEKAIASGNLQMFEYQLPINHSLQYYEARIAQSSSDEVFAIIRNITDTKHMKEQLEFLSLHDSLTGLYNRAYFEEEMKRLGKMRDGAAGLIICDLDGLKLINDALGHSVGDDVLKAVAAVLKAAFQPDNLIARIGGDEFAIILPSNSVPLFETACSRIRKIIEEYNSRLPTVPISLSVGFAVSRDIPIDSNALFKEADHKMYREKLHRQQSKKSAVVQALMKALEARDFLTEGHGDRLQGLVAALAAAIGLPDQTMADLRLLARFHDIGKVGIPDSILFKPGRLTADEYAVMQGHCEIGYRIAKTAPELDPIADGILKHQEWWNGEGYPLGLTGQEIPIECRILAIADAYDAMTNDRPYRKALSQAQAIDELRKGAGKQFDPKLVEPFIDLVIAGV